ncbi:MAG: hypothetical protein PVJ67_00905 [Candidatus Pacearchaeota archaeon]|jgi:small subunit ribosomal protein S4e
MAHLKRQLAPKNWPINRKGTAYVVRPNSNLEKGVPVLVILRDMLKIAQNRKEVKRAINAKNVLLNNRIIKDEKNNAVLFDVITIVPAKKHYKITLSKYGKFDLEEVGEKEAMKKVSKVVNKKTLKGKKTQLNLSDGRNLLSSEKCKTGDSVVISFKDKKIEKVLPMKEGEEVFIFAGKHAGKQGILRKLKIERKMASITVGEDNINVLIKQIMVVEK